ncbi:hypothetical protein AB1Y20_015945 [Prymnesium parvum]|uniref:Uncharacterized protein n=1 Tax=Prymnesium parvum TaxID=97485 RepID=A0AB34JZZ2_PRYPA
MASSCALPSGNWSLCTGPAYFTNLHRLLNASDPIPVPDERLLLPRGTRLLFYGFSYLRQLVDELFCADETARWRFVGRGEAWRPHCAGIDATTTWTHTFSGRDAVALVVTNVEELQHSRALHAALPRFVRQHGPFDVVFFQRPHADCFFGYLKASVHKWANESRLACVDLRRFGVGDQRKLARDGSIWQLLSSSARLGSFEVPPWGTKRRESPLAEAGQVIDVSTIIREWPCRVLDCAAEAVGHQCKGSALTLAARELVARAAASLASSSGNSTAPTGATAPDREKP